MNDKFEKSDEFEKYGYQLQAPIKGFYSCACGEPTAPNTVHRKDNPCYVQEISYEEYQADLDLLWEQINKAVKNFDNKMKEAFEDRNKK